MNALAPYITLETVRLDLDLKSGKRVFEEAALVFENAYGIPHMDAFNAMIERERWGVTTLGNQVQLPHGRLPDLEDVAVVILRTMQPVDINALEQEEVRLFCCMLAPDTDDELMQDKAQAIIRTAVHMLNDPPTREALMQTPTEVGVCEIVHQWEDPQTEEPLEDTEA